MRKMFAAVGVLSVLVAILATVAGVRAHLVHELRKPLLAQLGQPERVQFRNETYLGNCTAAGVTLCGEIGVLGAKHSDGGYQWFSVANGVFIENESLRRQFNEAGIKRCHSDSKPAGAPWWWLHW